jgi:segregation and condensation protein B
MNGVRLATGQLLRSASLRYRRGRPEGMAVGPPARNARFWYLDARSSCPPVRGGQPRSDELTSLEAILFLSHNPMSSRKLAQLAGLADGTKTRTLVRTLNRVYDGEGRAFRVEEVAGGFQLMTRPKFAAWLRRLQTTSVEVRLSGPALETLAVVAYRQPVLRADIEAIRGVQSGEVLRQLIDRDLVRIVGRSDELGRPFLYGTTKQFLQIFGLRHLDELPRAELLRSSAANAAGSHKATTTSETQTQNQPNQFPLAEEEVNVKTRITAKVEQESLAADRIATVREQPGSDRPTGAAPLARNEDEDVDDDEDDLEDDAEEDEDEDGDDEPWEEVEDDDEDIDEEDEDWDEDEDWEDDEDWDEEDEDEEEEAEDKKE